MAGDRFDRPRARSPRARNEPLTPARETRGTRGAGTWTGIGRKSTVTPFTLRTGILERAQRPRDAAGAAVVVTVDKALLAQGLGIEITWSQWLGNSVLVDRE